MGGIPDVMFVIDANKEDLAIKEAGVLGIPVVAVLDSNVDPSGIAFPIPGNDDAARAVRLYCDAVAEAASSGKGRQAIDSGQDVGAMANPPSEVDSAEAAAPVAAASEAAAPEAATEAGSLRTDRFVRRWASTRRRTAF
jgi:small subunit ribosomal protein S2